MSGRMQITFDADMPAATVEVVAPDLESVGRLWIAPGQQTSVDVPSEGSFLRVHLTSGEIVTLEDPGNLDRHISRSALNEQLKARRAQEAGVKRPKTIAELRGFRYLETFRVGDAAPAVPLKGVVARLLDGKNEIQARGGGDGAIVFAPTLSIEMGKLMKPYCLHLESENLRMRVRIPRFLEELLVRSDQLAHRKRIVTVRVRTTSAAADAMGGYLNRGDLHAAAAMSDWAAGAKELLDQKMRNPFAAAVGAYLLLRLRDFSRLHDWPKNLAEGFPNIADGSIIWAWQQIHQRGDEQEIRKFLQKALAAGLPVYTEGLRLLREGVTLIGDEAASQELNQRAGIVVWSSPFTATCKPAAGGASPNLDVDIDYAPRI